MGGQVWHERRAHRKAQSGGIRSSHCSAFCKSFKGVRRTVRLAHVFHIIRAGLRLRSFFCAIIIVNEVPLPLFDTEFDTTSHHFALLSHLVRVRPPLPALKYPVNACIWRFAGRFLLRCGFGLTQILERCDGFLGHFQMNIIKGMAVNRLHDV